MVSTTTTTYTYTPMPSPIKDTTNAAFAVAQGSPPAPWRPTAQKPASRPSASIYPDITDLQLDFPMSANMCSLAKGTHALQGPSTQAAGLLKNPQLPLVPLWSKVPLKPSQLAPSQLILYGSATFIQHYSRIVHPRDLPGLKLGINTYHVVICGQEVGVFYAE
jgi:hypothetical protein